MRLPFTVQEFFGVFTLYNDAIWPVQIALVVIAVVAVELSFHRSKVAARVNALILAALWAWTGVVYHWRFFVQINPAAKLFGALFIVQALVFLVVGTVLGNVRYGVRKDWYGIVGGLFMLYALAIYPLLDRLAGHVYPAAPTFGAPCPLVIFTFGLLLWTEKKVAWYVILIPFVWSLIGSTATFAFGVWQDAGLLVAGILGTAMLLFRDRRGAAEATAVSAHGVAT